MDIKKLNIRNHNLAEGPLWNVEEKTVYWTDINEKEIWKYNTLSKKTFLVWKGNMKVGGFAFTNEKGLMLFTDKGIFCLSNEMMKNVNAIPNLLYEIPMIEEERFNDITTDPMGRIYAGTMEPSHSKGKLYLIEKDKDPKVVMDGIGISNGMTFSPDLRTFYHTDSPKCTITKYSYSKETAAIENPKTFYSGKPEDGYPDGITCDTEGNIWVAFWGTSCIRCYSANGDLIRQIDLPAIQITSLAFGGAMMNTIFVTSASEGASKLETGMDKEGNYLGGSVYSIQSESFGREEWMALV